MVEKVIHNLNLVFPLLFTTYLVFVVDNVDNFGDNSVYSVCKAWETVGKYGFLCGNRKFCGFFIHILADFAVSFWAFPCFFLLFLVLPFYCFYFTGIYSSRK